MDAVRVSSRARCVVAFAIISLEGAFGMTAKASSPAEDPITLPVRLDNVAAVRQDDLQFAENRAGEVFEKIGVRVRWIVGAFAAEAAVPPLTMVVVNSDAKAGGASEYVDALGLAHPGVRRAYVFYDRVSALNERSPRPIPTILGDVIAHELGHLVLPTAAHAREGIMRPGLDMKQLSVVTFTKAEARSILSSVRAFSRGARDRFESACGCVV